MDFRLSSDEDALMGALEPIAQRYSQRPTEHHGFALVSPGLEAALVDGGYFDVATVPELGPLAAALAVERFARLPWTAEIALSMLVRPQLGGDLPRPLALVENGRPGRFVAQARTLLVLDGDALGVTRDFKATPADSLYAYPMARLDGAPRVTPLPADTAATITGWLRVALACEIAGLMQAALDSTVEHLTVRKQFGRPLGTFQALRHRLAECAVLTGGVRRLALKAAWSADAGDAALAALHAQDSATRLVYDLHQCLGAMGMTLEHPLHLWTYRIKALLGELGGRGGQSTAVARHCFTAEAGA